MKGRVIFSVICVVLSTSQLIYSQPPFRFHSFLRRQGSWGIPNEIHGNVRPMRPPPPGVLVAGHYPPGARPMGPVHSGARLVLTSSPPPPPSTWPNHGPQIQRAKESSHFEYEVLPHPMNRKPPTILRPGPSPPLPPTPSSSEMTEEIMRILAEEGSTPRPTPVPPPVRLMSRTDRPPMHPMRPPVLMPVIQNRPTHAAPTDSDFQEGYRILNDIFMEDSNGDIRNNLVGGSEISFNGGFIPFSNADAVVAQQSAQMQPQQKLPQQMQSQNMPQQMHSQQMQSQNIPQQVQSQNMPQQMQPQQMKPQQMHPQQMQPQNMPQQPTQPAHEQSQMTNETVGAASESAVQIVPADETPLPEDIAETEIEPTAQPSTQMEKSESSYSPPQFRNGPSHSSFMFTDPNEGAGGYTIHDHSYRGPPPPFHAGGNSIIPQTVPQRNQNNNEGRTNPGQGQQNQQQQQQQQQAPKNNGYANNGDNSLRMPIMMMPITPNKVNGNQPLPSSDEVQYALGILARYASKQAQQQGQQPQQQQSSSIQTSITYGPPQSSPSSFNGQNQGTPSATYGPPQQTQAAPSDSYGPPPQQNQQSPSAFGGGPSLEQQNSPNTGYGAPQQQQQQQQPSPNSAYGAPQQQQQQQPSPNSAYGAPQQQQQSTTISSYLPASALSTYELASGNQIQGPSGSYGTTEANAITISASNQLDESSSPFPVYGPPSLSYGVGGGGGGGGATGIIGAKVEALKTIQNAVKGGFRSITGLKAGILNAGLNAIGSLGQAKGQIANSLKIPVLPQKETTGGWVAYGAPSAPQPSYGPPEDSTPAGGWGQPQSSTANIINGVKDLVGQVTGTIAQLPKAAVGIGLSKNQFLKNNFAIKGQMFTDTMSKKIANKNQYFQNVLKHVQSIFDVATARPNTGEKNPW